MCGRYALVLSGKIDELPFVEESSQLELELPWECYNIAPTMRVPIVDSDRGVKLSTWGLIPHWSKTPPKRPLVNARLETAATKPSFRDAYKRHRCAVPASGFFEWTGPAKERVPYFIGPSESPYLWFAGLASWWERPEHKPLLSHTILTCSSMGTPLEDLHDRVPVALRRDQVSPWLGGEFQPEESDGKAFAEPYRVAREVNRTGHDDPSNLDPVEPS